MRKGLSFDYVLRSSDISIPKEVRFVPDSKIKLNTNKRKMNKGELHKRFLKSDSDESID